MPIFIGGSDPTSSSGGYMLTGGTGKSDNLLNNYVALLLQAFYHSGAYDALTRLGTTTEEGSHLNMQSKSLLKKKQKRKRFQKKKWTVVSLKHSIGPSLKQSKTMTYRWNQLSISVTFSLNLCVMSSN